MLVMMGLAWKGFERCLHCISESANTALLSTTSIEARRRPIFKSNDCERTLVQMNRQALLLPP
jgi:hypothetical protein